MKRKLSVFLVAIIFVSAFLAVLGCSRVDAGPMEELKGTYELTKYERVLTDSEETGEGEQTEQTEKNEEETINYLKDKQITMYLVITGECVRSEDLRTGFGKGYIAYKDNETSLFVKEVRINYGYSFETKDKEDGSTELIPTDLIETVDYLLPSPMYSSSKDVKTGWSSLGFVVKEHLLNVSKPNWSGCMEKIVNRDNVEFKRVAKDTDLTFVKKKLGDSFKVEGYALSTLNETYVYYGNVPEDTVPEDFGKYIYQAVKIDKENSKIDLYYALKTDKTPVEEKGLPVTFTFSEDGLTLKTLTFKEKTYNAEIYSLTYVEGDKIAVLGTYDDDLQNFIDTQLNAYNEE